MLNFKVVTADLGKAQDLLKGLGDTANSVAAAAINNGIDYARKIGGEAILDQVNFPANYLDLPERFFISQRAKPENPTATLSARRRPTSLGTFLQSGGGRGEGVTVKTQRKGSAKHMRRAFVTGALRNGNRGVALRTRGEKPSKAYKPVRLFSDDGGIVWLLYGPSVNQVFNDVAEDIRPRVNRFLERRTLQLLNARLGK